MSYKAVIPKEYAQTLKKNFYKNPSLWYKVILPKWKAEELMKKTNGDYSVIWHEHCECCWKTITSDTIICYCSDDTADEYSWLCKECYDKLLPQ